MLFKHVLMMFMHLFHDFVCYVWRMFFFFINMLEQYFKLFRLIDVQKLKSAMVNDGDVMNEEGSPSFNKFLCGGFNRFFLRDCWCFL